MQIRKCCLASLVLAGIASGARAAEDQPPWEIGAAFEDSPLVRQKDDLAAGIAITWILGESSTRVRTDD